MKGGVYRMLTLKAGLKDKNPPLKPDWKKGWKQDFKTAG